MKREAPTPSPLADLLVVLGTQRYGTDWTNVSAAIRAAAGPLESLEPPAPGECEDRFRALVEGTPIELGTLAAKLQARHLETLSDARASLAKRIEDLCAQLPSRHASRATFLAGVASMQHGVDANGATPPGEEGGDSKHGGRTRTSGACEGAALDHDLDESWVSIAEEEDRNLRRSTVAGTLNKMLAAIVKHKWAYPFKRPVTDKEAPDYKEFITNPMDFTTLKRRVETGQVAEIHGLVDDLNLIFDNAMVYNGEGTDYYKMASTLKAIVANQKAVFIKARGDSAEVKGAAVAAGASQPPTAEETDKAPRRGRVSRR